MEDEVIKLRQVGTKPGCVQHSGYDISLLEGKPTGEYSKITGGAVQSTMTYDSLPAETSFIPPPTYLKFPQYFSNIEHRRIYNPFQQSIHSTPLNAADNISQVPELGSPSVLEITENWSSGLNSAARSGTNPLQIADNWVSGSGAMSDSGGSPALAFDSEVPESNLATADLWLEDDDNNDNSGNEMEHSSYPAASNVLDLTDQWSDSGEEELDFSYGPEDFSFLCNDMFE